MSNKNNITSLNSYKGTHLEKSYVTSKAEEPKLSLVDQVNNIAKSCNIGFENGKTTEEELSKAFDQLEGKLTEYLEKSEPETTFEREGELGSYNYSLIEKAKDGEDMEGDEKYTDDNDMEKGMKYKGKMYEGKEHNEMYKSNADYKKAYDAMEKEGKKDY